MLSVYLALLLAAARLVTAIPSCSAPDSTTINTVSNTVKTDSVAFGWFANWEAAFTVADIPWKDYNIVSYFVADVAQDGTLDFSGISDTVTTSFVQAARANNVIASLSIGGWTGSRFFSPVVMDNTTRTALVTNVDNALKKYGFGAIDIDWEYPNKIGMTCNAINADDTNNFQSFLQELRSKVGASIKISATAVTPWNDAQSNPSKNLSGFVPLLDHLSIMGYDINGAFSTEGLVGPNSPLDSSCLPASLSALSVTSLVKMWTDAGFPANKIVLGVPSYGRGYVLGSGITSSQVMSGQNFIFPSYQTNTGSLLGTTDAIPIVPATDICGAPNTINGEFTFAGMMTAKYLNASGDPMPGFDLLSDSCSQTPYLYDSKNNVVISYDNAESMTAKGKFIKDNNLLGFAIYDIAGDSNSILTKAVSAGMGLDLSS